MRSLSPDKTIDDYRTLCKPETLNPSSLAGNTIMNYFFLQHRLRTKTKRGVSFLEWLDTDECETIGYYKRFIDKMAKPSIPLIQVKFRAFNLYNGAISAFKPIVAKWLYSLYAPKTVLDFSAGWGGRCLGAMSLGINYIGIDTNTTLKPAYDDMIALCNPTSSVQMIYADSSTIDYSTLSYDMVATSPPYYLSSTRLTEEYENMPKYANRSDFYDRFLLPVIRKTWEHLKPGGTYALNIPISMYEPIAAILGECTEKHPLHIAKRTRELQSYKEFIYVWKKPIGDVLPPPTWTSDLVHVAPSTIPNAGNGLFASKRIPCGTRFASYIGDDLPLSEYRKKYDTDVRYSYYLGRTNKIIDGRGRLTDNISHYINESNIPNVIAKQRGFYTTRDVETGEELFLKYHLLYPRNYSTPV